MKRCAVLLLGLLLAACAPIVAPGGDGVLLPEQLQRAADAYTATARVQATQAALAAGTDTASRATSTAARQATLDALGARQTESALQLTQSAGVAAATDAAALRTQAAGQTQAWATPTAAAIRTQGAAAAQDRAQAQAQAETVAEFWQTIRFIVAALLVVGGLTAIAVVAIDRISRVRMATLREKAAIAREAFRLLPPGHWAEYQPDDGYRVYELPGPLDEPPTVIENAAASHNTDHDWRHAVRLFCWWGDMYGFSLTDLGPAGRGVVSDPAWRLLARLLRDAGVLADVQIPGQKGKETGWAPNWGFARVADELSSGKLALPFPSGKTAPKVAFTVPNMTPQHA